MKYVIIGNGVAGIDAAIAIRRNDSQGEITIITRSAELHYYRPRIIEYLADEVTMDKITMYKEEFYRDRNITNVLGRKVMEILPDRHEIVDDKGTGYPYDRLLIAAGGYSFMPPVAGSDREGVYTLRDVPDADRIKVRAADVDSVAVIGGGLLGLETAHSMIRLGKKVTVIEFAPWLLPRQLDQAGGRKLQSMLEAKGMNFVLNDSTVSIEGGKQAEAVILKSGKRIEAGLVIVSAGIRCNIELAKKAGIAVNGGIIVDDWMKTSAPDIYAAGDVAEHRGKLYGIWPAAKEQGAAAGANMAGSAQQYTGTLMATALKITGIDLYSAGDISDTGKKVIGSENDSCYRRLFVEGEKATGAIVLGDKEAVKIAQRIISGKADITEFDPFLN